MNEAQPKRIRELIEQGAELGGDMNGQTVYLYRIPPLGDYEISSVSIKNRGMHDDRIYDSGNFIYTMPSDFFHIITGFFELEIGQEIKVKIRVEREEV